MRYQLSPQLVFQHTKHTRNVFQTKYHTHSNDNLSISTPSVSVRPPLGTYNIEVGNYQTRRPSGIVIRTRLNTYCNQPGHSHDYPTPSRIPLPVFIPPSKNITKRFLKVPFFTILTPTFIFIYFNMTHCCLLYFFRGFAHGPHISAHICTFFVKPIFSTCIIGTVKHMSEIIKKVQIWTIITNI